MGSLETYCGTAVRDIIADSVPWANESDVFVFLMGPYRLLDPSYIYPDTDYPLPPDPLAPANDGVPADEIQATLRSIAKAVSEETPATVFIATDVDIPTQEEAAERTNHPGMPVIDQSVAFAKASTGNAFVFTKAGLTTGAGAEVGAIPEYFELRNADAATRDPGTFCIFEEAEWQNEDEQKRYDPKFSSASIDEMDAAYDIPFRYFVTQTELEEKLISFIESYVVPLA